MKFDRSQFKSATVEGVKKIASTAERTMGRKGMNYTQFTTVEKGKNIFRVVPSKSGRPYMPFKGAKLKVEVDNYEDDKKVGKKVIEKTIFTADIHGKNLLGGKDPIITYCSYVYAKAKEEYQDENERKKYLNPVSGYKKGNKFVWGISPILNYICYVWKGGQEFERLQLRSAWLDRINEVSVEMSDDDTLSMDIFSDPSIGYPLQISLSEDAKGKKSYSISAKPQGKLSLEEFFEENAIPDTALDYFVNELPSLDKLYDNSYTAKDFKMALDGLKRFDDENGYEIFADEAFLNEIEEMAAMLPDEDDEQSEEDKKTPFDEAEEDKEEAKVTHAKTKKVAPAKAPAAEAAAKTSGYPPLSKMKKFLGEYIAEEYPGMELPEDLMPSDIREWYDLANEGESLPFPEEEEQENDPDPEPEPEIKKTSVKVEAKEIKAEPAPTPESEEEEDPENDSDPEDQEDEKPVETKATTKSSDLKSDTKARLEALKAKLKK